MRTAKLANRISHNNNFSSHLHQIRLALAPLRPRQRPRRDRCLWLHASQALMIGEQCRPYVEQPLVFLYAANSPIFCSASTNQCDVYSRTAFILFAVVSCCGVYSRTSTNRVNTVIPYTMKLYRSNFHTAYLYKQEYFLKGLILILQTVSSEKGYHHCCEAVHSSNHVSLSSTLPSSELL